MILPLLVVNLAFAIALLPHHAPAEVVDQRGRHLWFLLEGGLAVFAFRRLCGTLGHRRFALQ